MMISMTPQSTFASRYTGTSGAALRFSGNKPTAAIAATAPVEQLATFKTLGDTVVWQQGSETKTVAQMAVILCTKEGDYPGYGTVDRLTDRFPDLNTKVLDASFLKLAFDGYLTSNFGMKMGYQEICETGSRYVVTPKGLEALKAEYPDLELPSESNRFIANYTPNN